MHVTDWQRMGVRKEGTEDIVSETGPDQWTGYREGTAWRASHAEAGA